MPSINWNFLTPYLTPLSRPLERGVQGALQHSRFNRSFGESKRRYDEGSDRRGAELEKVTANNTKRKQLQKMSNMITFGAEGEPLDRPADVDALLASEIARANYGLPGRNRRFVTTTDKLGGTQGQFVSPDSDKIYTSAPRQRQPGWTSERNPQGIETSTFGVPQIGDTRTKHPMPAQGAGGGQGGTQGKVPDIIKTAQSFVLKFAPMLAEPVIQGMLAANPDIIENPAFMEVLQNKVPPQYRDLFKGYMAILKEFMKTQVKDISGSQGGGQVTTGDDFMTKHGLK